MRPSRRSVIVLAVVAFWAVMMALLFKDQFLVPRLETRGTHFTAADSWMGIYLGEGPRIGFVNVRTVPGEREGERGATLHVRSRMTLDLLGNSTELGVRGTAWMDAQQGFSSGEFTIGAGPMETAFEARRVGEGEAAALELTVETGGESHTVRVPAGESLSLVGTGGLTSMPLPNLEVGDEFRIDTFDPVSMTTAQARVKCIGRETIEAGGKTHETSVVTVKSPSMQAKAWVDAQGEVVRMDTPLGISLRRITPEEALEDVAPGTGQDLLRMTAVQPTGQMPFRGAKEMRFEVGGVEDTELPTDLTQRQVSGNVYRIVVPEPPAGTLAIGETPPELAEDLLGDPFVQIAHSEIRSQAAQIVGEETRVWPAALALYEWVYANIEKEAVPSIPSALEVLRTRVGDCNEHTVLYAALARAAGIPTRIAIGVVWSDELGGFYYHAWPKVYALDAEGQGRWRPLDPTLGQPIADATHIELLTGSLDRWPQLIPYLGKLELNVLDIE